MKNRAAFVLLALLSFGCSHTPTVTPSLVATGLTPAMFWKDQAKRLSETDKISGKVSLRFEGQKNTVSGKGRFLAEVPKLLRLELRDPLGRLQYILASGGEKLVAYYPRQKLAYLDDSIGLKYVRTFLGMNLSFEDFERLLLGIVPGKNGAIKFKDWQWDAERNQYRGEIPAKNYRMIAFVDGTTASLKSVRIELGSEIISVTYDNFENCCQNSNQKSGVSFGTTVRLALEKSQGGVEVEWDQISKYDAPKTAETFRVTLPDDVKKIILH